MSEAQRQPGAPRRKRLMLILPTFHGYEERIVEAAERLGYECLRADERIGNGFVAKLLTRLGIIQRIRPLMDRYLTNLVAAAKRFEPDIVLVINAETLTARSVARFRAQVPDARFLIYMWDSSSKKNIPPEMYRLFDWAGSFDPQDCADIPGLHHLPLFHRNEAPAWDAQDETEFDVDCVFIGTARMRRMQVLAPLARELDRTGRSYHFYLYAPSLAHYLAFSVWRLVTGYRGVLSRKAVPYAEYQRQVARARCGIDVEQSHQNGLTMRTLEVVFSGRPLLTTNRWAERYDFAQVFPVGVYVPGEPVTLPGGTPGDGAEALFAKYGLANWLASILEERVASYLPSESDPTQNRVGCMIGQSGGKDASHARQALSGEAKDLS